MNKPKILFYDIETSPNLAYVWEKYEQNVLSYVKEWDLLSVAYKFQGDKTVKCFARPDFHDLTDRSITVQLHKLLASADVIIAHNGNSFDIKKSNAKFIEHGLSPIKPIVSIDTKLVARNLFKFNSNSLNDIGTLLKVGNKLKHTGFDLWLGCMKGDAESWELMKKYNKQDIVLLEKVYNKMMPFMKVHPNMALLQGKTVQDCPKCGSSNVKKDGIRANSASLQQQLKCNDCKGYFLRPLKRLK